MNTRHKKVVEAHGGTCSGSFNFTESCNTNFCPGTLIKITLLSFPYFQFN